MATKGHDAPKIHFQTCTGFNRLIMRSVWNKPETFWIVAEVMQTYRAFSQHAEPGEVFDVVLYCTSGCHRSVAVALLLEMIVPFAPWAYGNNDDEVSVIIVHRSQDMDLWKKKEYCRQECTNCRGSAFKKLWMRKEMMKVAEHIGRVLEQKMNRSYRPHCVHAVCLGTPGSLVPGSPGIRYSRLHNELLRSFNENHNTHKNTYACLLACLPAFLPACLCELMVADLLVCLSLPAWLFA